MTAVPEQGSCLLVKLMYTYLGRWISFLTRDPHYSIDGFFVKAETVAELMRAC